MVKEIKKYIKWDINSVKEKMKEINPNTGILSNEYVNSKTHLKCRCLIDGHEWNATWSNLQKGRGCSICGIKSAADSKRFSLKTVKKRLKQINPNVEILSDEYVGALTHLKCKCLIDDHEWSITWNNLRKGRKCPKCSRESMAIKLALSIEDVKKRLYEMSPSIEILSDKYVNANIHLKCKCLIDDCEWSVTWGSLSQGSGCPKCAGMYQTLEDIKERLEKINPNIKILSDEYVSAKTKLKCKCLIDGYEWGIHWGNLQSGYGCPKCGGKLKLNQREVEDRISKLHQNIKIGKYIDAKTPIDCTCLVDGFKWNSRLHDLMRSQGCPLCSSGGGSKGERVIVEHLSRCKIKNIREYTFKECKHIRPLPFDFALFDHNKTLISLIEYDGEQHFKPVNFGGMSDEKALEGHQNTVRNDNIKNQYCKDNNIPLLRIPYWEFDNIETILHSWLVKHGLIEDELKEVV